MSANNNSNQAQQMAVKKFVVNYQLAFNNYNNAIKYYTKYKQMIEEIEKIVNAYKETIKDFQKKVIILNSNLKKIFLNEDMRCFKYDIFPTTNKYIKYLNNIFNLHISSITNVINDLDKNVFKPNKKEEANFLNIIQQNKNNLQNEQKKMEKSINEYDNEHKNLMYMFQDTEENLRNFFIKKRKARKDSKTKKQNNNMDKFNSTISNLIKVEEKFRNLDINFQNNNSNYFHTYNIYLKELQKEVLKNSKYVHENFLSISSILTNNYETIIGKLKEFNEKIKKDTQKKQEKKEESKEEKKEETKEEQKEEIKEEKKEETKEEKKEEITPKIEEENPKPEKEIPQKEETPKNEEENKNTNLEFINEDFNLYISKNFNKIETTYEKEKYKVKAIKETVLDDKLGKETKNIMNDLSSEFGLGHLVEEEVIILTEEDVYEITKTLYGPFQYVDKSEYDLVIERKKIDFKNLTNKLLYYGFKEKTLKNFPDLTPITDEEIKILENGLKKKVYRITFLQRLNNFRALGTLEMPQKEFEIIGNFFKLIADYTDEEKDVESIRFLIILSQTFYFLEDKNNKKDKKYLLVYIRGHKFFSDKKFWKEYIENSIKGEIEKTDKIVKISNGKIKNSYNDICFAQILPFSDNMADFGMPKEILLDIIEPLYEKYNLTEDMKVTIKGVFETKYQQK